MGAPSEFVVLSQRGSSQFPRRTPPKLQISLISMKNWFGERLRWLRMYFSYWKLMVYFISSLNCCGLLSKLSSESLSVVTWICWIFCQHDSSVIDRVIRLKHNQHSSLVSISRISFRPSGISLVPQPTCCFFNQSISVGRATPNRIVANYWFNQQQLMRRFICGCCWIAVDSSNSLGLFHQIKYSDNAQ